MTTTTTCVVREGERARDLDFFVGEEGGRSKEEDEEETTTTTTSPPQTQTQTQTPTPPLCKFREAVVKVLSTITAEPRPLRSKFGTTAVCISKDSKRRKVFKAVFSRTFEYLLFSIVFAHFAVLAVLLAKNDGENDDGNYASGGFQTLIRKPLWAVDFAILIFYTCEMALKMYALGVFGSRHAYLTSNAYNRLDCFIVTVSWMSVMSECYDFTPDVFPALPRLRLGHLRVFRATLALRSFSFASSVIVIMEALSASIPLLRDVIGVSCVCFVFYALMGVSTFGGSFRRRCVIADSKEAARVGTYNDTTPFFCGDVENTIDGKGFVCPGAYFLDTTYRGESVEDALAFEQLYASPVLNETLVSNALGLSYSSTFIEHELTFKNMFCSDKVGNPRFGKQSFDDFFAALTSMFTCITLEEWPETMYVTVNSEFRASAAYYITLIIVGTYFIVSVFVAAVSGVFLRLRREHVAVLKHRNARERTSSSTNEEEEEEFVKGFARFTRLKNALRFFKHHHEGGEKKDTFVDIAAIALERNKSERGRLSAYTNSDDDDECALSSPNDIEEGRKLPTRKIKSGVARNKRDRVNEIVSNPTFDLVSRILIVLNTCSMCAYKSYQPDTTKRFLDGLDYYFLAVFYCECGLRLFAAKGILGRIFSLKQSLKPGELSLIWDFLVLSATAAGADHKGPNLVALRVVRLFDHPSAGIEKNSGKSTKVSSTTKGEEHSSTTTRSSSGGGNDTLARVFRSFGTMLSLLCFYGVVLAAYALLGMQLFPKYATDALKKRDDDANIDNLTVPYPRENFETYPNALLAIFTVSTGEGWVAMLYHFRRVTWLATPYFVSFFVLVNYVVLNLIIAVILENLELRDFEKNNMQRREIVKREVERRMRSGAFVDRLEKIRVWFVLKKRVRFWNIDEEHEISPWLASRARRALRISVAIESAISERNSKKIFAGKRSRAQKLTTGSATLLRQQQQHERFKQIQPIKRMNAIRRRSVFDTRVNTPNEEPKDTERLRLQSSSFSLLEQGKKAAMKENMNTYLYEEDEEYFDIFHEEEHFHALPAYFTNKSLGAIPLENKLRQMLQRWLSKKWYERISYLFVVVSIAAVLGADPVTEVNPHQFFLDAANALVAGYFLLDFLIKIVSDGLIFTPTAYFSSMWNILDTLVLCVDVVIVAGPIVFSSIWNWYFQRAINVLVSLRMFRVLSRNTKMQRLVVSVTQTLPSIGSVIKLTFAIFLAFAIVGVRIFGGKFGFCEQILDVTQSVSSSTYVTKRLDIDQYSCDLREDTYWNSPKYDFDWIGSALLTLFETASLDGWIDIMHHAMDIGGNKNANWPACLFFITFILCGSFMMIRTIIGVFIDRFGISSGLKLLTERQKLWRDMHGVAMSIKPMRVEMKPVVGSVRRKCYDAIHSKMFKKVILFLLSLNIVLLATVHFDADASWEYAWNIGDVAFVSIYLLESLARLFVALPHPLYFFKDPWNCFELFLSCGSAATLFPTNPSGVRAQIGRPFRFLRTFRILRHATDLRRVSRTMILAVPSILSVIGVMLIWMFLYAAVGTQVFFNVKYGESLNKDANFSSFVNSFLLLFQVLTGEGWRQFMYDLQIDEPHCSKNHAGDNIDNCGFGNGATFYFVTYVVAMGYIFTNLFVATILDHVTFGVLRESSLVSTKNLEDFQTIWSTFDPNATGFIGLHQIWPFLKRLPEPLSKITAEGEGNDLEKEKEKKFKTDALRLRYLSTISKWRRRIFAELHYVRHPNKGVPFSECLDALLHAKLGNSALTLDTRLRREKELEHIDKLGACVYIQRVFRGHRVRRKKERS